ncbi:MAG: AsmA family protein [Betaproteobacteria bacterium]|nr:AsmA family protein [Betaproteobacteria bacterium]
MTDPTGSPAPIAGAGQPARARPSLLLRIAKWTAWTLAAIVLLVAGAVAYVAFVGVTVDASLLRDPIASAFSDALHREVRFDGPAEIEISGEPWLRIGGLHVANPGGFGNGTLASLGEVRLAVDLWQLLQHRVHIRELSGSDVTVRLVTAPDGSNNWTFQFPKRTPAPAATPDGAPKRTARDAALMLDIRKVSLRHVTAEYVARDGTSHFFDLDSLAGEARQGEQMQLTMQGRVEKSFPYSVSFTGGPLSALIGSAAPWPMTLRLEFLSTVLNLRGDVRGTSGDVDFALGTADLSELARLLQTTFPKVGASALAGHVKFDAQHVAVTGLTGVMGATSMRGTIAFDSSGPRPKVTGDLSLPTLDLRPFLSEKPDTTEEPPRSLRDTYRELAAATFSLRALRGSDVDLRLAVIQWLNLPGNVHDAVLHLRLDDGRLEAPVAAVVTGVALHGTIAADATTDPPQFELALGTEDSNLGGLAELLTGARGVEGHLGRFSLRLAARGDQGSELVQSLDVHLDVDRGRFSYGNIEGGRPVKFALDRLRVALPAGKALSGSLSGNLLGQPVRASLSGGTLERVMLDQRTPLALRVRSGTVRARLTGILEAPGEHAGPELDFDLSGRRTADVARWLGIPAGASVPVALSGHASMTNTTWRVDDLAFRLGRTRFDATARSTLVDGHPLLHLELKSPLIDVAELQSLLPPRRTPRPAGPDDGRPVLDIPILPKGIDLGNADVQVRVQRVEGTPLVPRDLAFDGRIRDGAMQPSAFGATIADIPFRGAVSLDLRGSQPTSSLWLAAQDVDVGSLLRRYGLSRDLEAHVGAIRLNLTARSSLLGELLARSELIGNVDDAVVTLRDPNTHAEARVLLHSGELSARPGQPVRLDLEGSVDKVPIHLGLVTATAEELVKPHARVPFRLDAKVPDLNVQLQGAVTKPVGKGDVVLDLKLDGTRFDKLNGLVRASLPPWGPYSASGRFRMSARGYEVSDLELRVGSSTLRGHGLLDTARPKPRLDVTLSAPTIQLDDFEFGNWSPVEKKPEQEKTLTTGELKAKAAAASDRAQKLLSPAVLRRQDVFLDVRVDQVLSGKDKLGSGHLEARLENGRADIGPVDVNIPGGSARLWLGYEPTDQEVKVNTRIDVDHFDYGILARRIKPDTDLRGKFSLKLDVNSHARYLSDILKFGSGKIDFAVWPVNMKSGVFDLWAVNVLVALVPAVDPASASHINCAIGRFSLQDGRLVDRTILLDTSRMRVRGQGRANFRDEELKLRMQPKPKVPQFLSLATPIEVTGTFGNFKVGVSAGDILGTVARLASSIFWVPIEKLVSKSIPADGHDVCDGPL